MVELYDRYMKGLHQEVYDEILVRNEEIFESSLYQDVQLVLREIMHRVLYNIEVLIPRLRVLKYRFGEGFWNQFDDLSLEEKAEIEKDVPIFKAPESEITEKIGRLEHLVGTLPLSLKCWYENVGSVNLIGLFDSSDTSKSSLEYGCALDPLFMYSIEMVLNMVEGFVADDAWKNESLLTLLPDNYYKYGFSGSGVYAIRVPSPTFDAPLVLERHQTTFINYLRLCFQWGGFPGLEQDNRLTSDELAFLTQDLRIF